MRYLSKKKALRGERAADDRKRELKVACCGWQAPCGGGGGWSQTRAQLKIAWCCDCEKKKSKEDEHSRWPRKEESETAWSQWCR